jgi:hypothetical protein
MNQDEAKFIEEFMRENEELFEDLGKRDKGFLNYNLNAF